MSGETVVTIIGQLVDEVEMRFTPAGAAVAKFRVASTPRKFNRETNTWEDDKDGALFLSCSVWRQQAENAAATLQKGMRVIVQGRLKQRSYEDREGVKRTVFEVDVEEVAVSLLRATAAVTKVSSGQGQQAYREARQQQGQRSVGDPWSSGTPGVQRPAGDGWGQEGGGYSDEPPF